MRRLLVDKYMSDASKNVLSSLGYELIETVVNSNLCGSTSTHPDMQFFLLENKKALICAELADYYSSVLNDFDLITVSGIESHYPNDCILNIAAIGDKTLITKFQYDKLNAFGFENSIFINQGYAKCSTCILNDNAVITGDPGIIKSLESSDIHAYFLSDKQISLAGYKNGFWGGCSGLLDKGRLFFNGDIERLDCYCELMAILKKEKIEPIYQRETPLIDNGSIILLDI